MTCGFTCGKSYIRDLRKAFMGDDDILVYDSNVRGGSAVNVKVSANQKVIETMWKEITNMINEKHSLGEAIIARDDVAYLLEKLYIRLYITTASKFVQCIIVLIYTI